MLIGKHELSEPIIMGILNVTPDSFSDGGVHYLKDQAVARALQQTTENAVLTRWSGALGSAPAFELSQTEGMIRETRSCRTSADLETTFAAFSSLGGDRGWLFWSWAWSLRGLLDRLVGGPGLRRGLRARRRPRRA